MVGTQFDLPTEVEERPSKGPVCADCGKPYRLPPDKGGCSCPRFALRPEANRPALQAADRQAVALEGILAALQAIAKNLGAM